MDLSDRDFVENLRAAVAAYLTAVDQWESTYNQFYRLPGEGLNLSGDMQAAQAEYELRSRELEPILARAHQLCLKHQIPNPLQGLLRITLGQYTPQQRMESAISRNERNAVTGCLMKLAEATSGQASIPPATEAPAPKRSDRRAAVVGILCGVAAAAVIGVRMSSSSSEASPVTPSTRPPIDPGARARKTRFFRMVHREMTSWGDYGDILQDGMTAHLARTRGLLSLERTGPYMPPITFPGIGDVVLNAEGRKLLESSPLTGFGFQPVYKARIVRLPWNTWDLKADEPREFPHSGEPEDYILERRDDGRVARQMGDIWELVVPVTARIGRPRRMVGSSSELWLERDSWNGADIFRGDGLRSPLLTERAKAWFQENLGPYVKFEEFAYQ